jgi:hypothetical protein
VKASKAIRELARLQEETESDPEVLMVNDDEILFARLKESRINIPGRTKIEILSFPIGHATEADDTGWKRPKKFRKKDRS